MCDHTQTTMSQHNHLSSHTLYLNLNPNIVSSVFKYIQSDSKHTFIFRVFMMFVCNVPCVCLFINDDHRLT